MKYVTTWSMEPFLNGSGTGWIEDEYLLASMVGSLRRVHKWTGEKPTLYADKVTSDIIKELSDDVIIEEMENVFEEDGVPHTLWSYAKQKTMSMQEEPYLHFDLDLHFKAPISPQKLDCDLLIQCYDDFELMQEDFDRMELGSLTQLYNYEAVKDIYKWEGWWNRDWYAGRSANLGILGVQNMELNKRYSDLIFGWIDENREQLNRYASHVPHPAFFEQQPLIELADEMGLKTNTMFPNSVEYSPAQHTFVHFVGQWKNMKGCPVRDRTRDMLVKPFVTDDVKYFTKKLQGMKK